VPPPPLPNNMLTPLPVPPPPPPPPPLQEPLLPQLPNVDASSEESTSSQPPPNVGWAPTIGLSKVKNIFNKKSPVFYRNFQLHHRMLSFFIRLAL
jgi:hypothetical protein